MVRFARQEDLERVNDLRKEVNELHVNGRPDIFKGGFGEEIKNYINKQYPRVEIDVIEGKQEVYSYILSIE